MIFIFPFQNLYLHNNFCQKIVFNNTENRSNFRRFFAFLPPPPLTFQKIKLLKKWKKAWRYYHFTHTINDNHMMYWDMEHEGQNLLQFWTQKIQNSEKRKKNTWRYDHFTHVDHKWQSYDVWFLRFLRNRVWQTEHFVILELFLSFYPPPLTTQKKKKHGDIITCVQ